MKKAKSKKKVLLVEDEEFLREILSTLLVESGFEVSEAPDGEAAQYILGVRDFDLIITDIKMPKKDGLELLKWINTEKKIPVILMTGFAELIETKTAEEMGACGFLPKPFKKEDLLEQVSHCINLNVEPDKAEEEKSEKKQEDLNQKYCSVSIDDFIAGKQMTCDIYVKISDAKYVKIAYAGEDLSMDRIRDYKKKNVQFLYLLYNDFQAYLKQSLKITRALVGAKSISKEKKLNFLKHAGNVIHEKLYIADVDQETFQNARDFMSSTLDILSDQDDVVNMMGLLNQHADFLYAHSLGVSLYSVMIAKRLGWHSVQTLYKVSMGGLLHDIGKKEINIEILKKNRMSLTQSELAIYETHPARGLELIGHMQGIPEDISEIIYQHHEDCLGYGYPNKLTRTKIHPLAKLVSVANVFCNLTLKSPASDGMSSKEALLQMSKFYKDALDPKILIGLYELYKFNPDSFHKKS